MESKDEIPLVCLCMRVCVCIYIYIYIYIYVCVCVCVCVCVFFIYVCLIVSSPYLFVFGDDRVCGTREQMMLQVDLVRHRVGAGASLREDFYQSFIMFLNKF